MPRRIGTERHTELRSVRTSIPNTDDGSRRATNWPLSTRASSRGIRRAARWAGIAPITTASTNTPERTVTPSSQRHSKPIVARATNQTVGMLSRMTPRRPLSWRASPDSPKSTLIVRTMANPCGWRRIASMVQATICAMAVEAASQSSDRQRGRGHQAGGQAVGHRAEQDPGLHQPRDVERGEQQRAEVVGGRADREGHALVAGQQLATTARGDGRDDRQEQERRERGRLQQQHVAGAFGVAGAGERHRQRARGHGQAEHDRERPGDGRLAAYRSRTEAHQVPYVGQRTARLGHRVAWVRRDDRSRASRGEPGRHGPPPPPPSRPSPPSPRANRRAARGRRCTPGWPARAGGWRRGCRRRGRGRRR